MKKHWPKFAAATAVIASLVLYFTYWRSDTEAPTSPEAVNPAYREFISAYTAGVISSSSSFTVTLSQDIVEFDKVGQEAGSLFDFSPSIVGKTIWQDRRTVRFQPDERLRSGALYEVSFKLSKVITVPKDLEVFTYTIKIIPQNYELTVNNLKPYVKTELTRQQIQATLVTADFAEKDQVEKVVTALQDGKPLKITWTHAGDGKQHDFVVEDVTRQEKQSLVTLKTDGESLGIDKSEDVTVDVPGLADFKVTSVRLGQSGAQHVIIQFSDPLKEKQSLQGLVTIGDIQNLDFEINDNLLLVYPPAKQSGTQPVFIAAGVQNVLNYKMGEGVRFELLFEAINPAVRFTKTGTILPSSDGIVLPFEAVSLKAVDVQIVRIFESNVLQFLQVNDFDGRYELQRVGRPVHTQVMQLESMGVADLGKWNRFTLDLSKMIQPEPGAIYQVKLSFRRSQSAYPCVETDLADQDPFADENWSETPTEQSYWDGYEDYYGEDFDWEQRNNPCHKSYFNRERTIIQNLIASDLGLLAKRGDDGSTVVFVNDLKTTNPLSGVDVELFNYQQQPLGTAKTDSDGKVVISTTQPPSFVVAKSGAQRGYLKVADGEALSLSNFNISGERIKDGLKGFLYGERGVWRPGDSLYFSFILESKTKAIPENHPVVFELENPDGQVTTRMVRSSAVNGFYTFPTRTDTEAPTGNWTARVKVGQASFTDRVRIEMVKPNRLKIKLDFGKERLTAADKEITGALKVDWLQGNPGRNLDAEFDLLLTKGETRFEKYPDFVFDNPFNNFTSEDQRIFEGSTDEEGKATLKFSIGVEGEAPGVLRATFRGKVFEDGGNYSLDRFTIPYYPFVSFIGIRVPPGDKARGMLLTDTTHQIDVVTLDADGNPASRDGVSMSLHKLQWKWWWDTSESSTGEYQEDNYERTIATGTIKTTGGKGSWKFRVNHPEWGRYLLRATDPVSGHTTGKIIYIDWPGWAGRAQEGSGGATLLSFTSDKEKYSTGEKIQLSIPGSNQGRALVSVENGTRVLQTMWVETKAGENIVTLDAKPEMAPNCFVFVTLLQPHAQVVNDLPIRLYGVIPVRVEDPETHLEPTLSMPEVLEPGQTVTLQVAEAKNRPMTYTIAMVEDGLLDLTRFKTPDPWNHFYSREALGVKSWDLYNSVMGAFGGRIERLMAVGGDNEIAGKEGDKKNNRFKPVVKFLGPFTLSGGTNKHTLTMPNYIGSVRTMVVAGRDGAYGKTDKTTPVRKPLMVLATLPRVLGPDEKLKLPVTLFRMEKSIKNVKLDVSIEGPVTLEGQSSRTVEMSEDDLTTEFDLSVRAETGVARITIKASSGNAAATDEINIEIRNPSPSISKVDDGIIESGQTWSGSATPVGLPGTNTSVVEISTIPAINLDQRLRYLIQYPYGCVEQTTSSAFPQLYLDRIKALSDNEKARINSNLTAAVQRLKSFQAADGGFGYWPGVENADSWSTSYVGHFLTEAEAKGYYVAQEVLKRWKSFQHTKAQQWRRSQELYNSDLIQAYRLYTLANANDPDLASMNRLREMTDLQPIAGWMLAAAYARAGQREAALAYIAKLPLTVKPYQEQAYTYGSDLRDKAVILETLVLLEDRKRGVDLLKEIAASLSKYNHWYSTQTVAWCLKSVASFAGSNKAGPMNVTYSYKGKDQQLQTDLPMIQVDLPVEAKGDGDLKISSKTGGPVFVRVISQGTPSRSQEESVERDLGLTVAYTDKEGNNVNPASVEQGTTIVVTVTVTNPGTRGSYKNLALNHIFPSGWEVNNLRLSESQDAVKSDAFTYQDIRDDRVYTYFDLPSTQRKTFRYLVTASFSGKYYLPAVKVEAMYDASITARTKGQEVEVTRK